MKISANRLKEIIKEEISTTFEGDYHDMGGEDEMYDAIDAGIEQRSPVQKIEAAYHELEDVFQTLDDEQYRDLAAQIISRLQTLMDTMEHPEDYRE
tara:strand:+ start:398 stop:685 length:288 start_codon:yes stop_codon:yes gene_type:complete